MYLVSSHGLDSAERVGRHAALLPVELAGPAMPRLDAVAGPAVQPPKELSVTGRVRAFGYLRSVEPEVAKLSILHGELVLHAGRHELDLVAVFDDVPCADLPVGRPGFTRLVQTLWRHDGALVLVPARCHLSWQSALREQLERSLLDTGARLLALWGDDERPELQP